MRKGVRKRLLGICANVNFLKAGFTGLSYQLVYRPQNLLVLRVFSMLVLQLSEVKEASKEKEFE